MGSVLLQGRSVKLCAAGGPGRALLELRFESIDRAQEWSYMLQKRCAASKALPSVAEEEEVDSPVRAPSRSAPRAAAVAPESPAASSASAASPAAAASTLRALVEQ